MRLTVKLVPPYCKPEEAGEYVLELAEARITLQQLAVYLSQVWENRLAVKLVDEKGDLTAEFMVGGRIASRDTVLAEGDRVMIVPLICGG